MEPRVLDNGVTVLPDGSGFFVDVIDPDAKLLNPVRWNPWQKVVSDHRTGDIDDDRTNAERAKRGLPVPWTPEMADREVREDPID
jgi:hypothetical protein